MLPQYPVLDNKPIDQLKVTELREELRRRNLATKGLKEELVKRLDEAMQKEKESGNEIELGNGVESNLDLQNNTDEEDAEAEGAERTHFSLNEDNCADKDAAFIDVNHGSECRDIDAIEAVALIGEDEENKASLADLKGSVFVNHDLTSQSGMQVEDAEPDEKFEQLKLPLVEADEKEVATMGNFGGSKPVDQNLSSRSGLQGDDAEHEKLAEAKLCTAGVDEKAATTGDSEGSWQVKQSVNAQSGMQSEEDKPEGNFGDPISSMIETDEDKAATTGDLEGSVPVSHSITTQPVAQIEDDKAVQKFEELKKPSVVDSMANKSELRNQVSEISQDLEFQVKYETNYTDSVSINEMNNIKDNLSADRFPLELEVIKQEMVQPSSSSCLTGGRNSCMAVDEQEEARHHAIGEQDGSNNEVSGMQEVGQNILSDEQGANSRDAINEQYIVQSYSSVQHGLVDKHAPPKDSETQNTSTVVLLAKEDCVEAGSPEKLNLDRSSSDESLEEDVLEGKHMEVDIKYEEVADKIDARKAEADLDQRVDSASRFSPEMKNIAVENVKPAALTEKRKLEEAEPGNNFAPKRHRPWNPDTIKIPEQQAPSLDISMTPKNTVQPNLRRTFSRSNSMQSVDLPKGRVVPTPKKLATTSLRIDNFLRPFTLKAVQELLAQTGVVRDFWMDHIKTHCYVTYSSVEEATETRNAIYNLQWPPNGGRLLVAEFVDPQEVKSRLEAPPPQAPTPISPTPAATPRAPPPSLQPKIQSPQPAHQQNLRQQPLPPPLLSHLPPPPLPPPPSNPPPVAREQRLPLKTSEPPVVTLDDLFKKTKATPRIYYLPLSEEQVGAKLAAQGKSNNL